LLCLLAGLTACDSLLQVDAPSQVPAENALRPENATLLMNSAIGAFECAFGGTIVQASLLGDELANASFGNTFWQIDRRDMTPASPIGTGGCAGVGGGVGGGYGALSAARWLADELLRQLDGWTEAQVPNRAKLIARTAAYSGYNYVILGETMCTGAVDIGPELTKAQLFALAEAKFSQAITGAQGGDADVLNMALVGRARTRLDLGNAAGAAADAQLVPVGFVINATYSGADPRRENPVFDFVNRDGGFTVGPVYRDFRFAGVPDPRVPVVDGQRNGQDNLTRLWIQNKFPNNGAPIAIAKWEEAQLILAETRLAASNLQGAVDIINLLHSRTTPALPQFASTNAADIKAQILYERRAELFLESQHLYDNIRFNTPLIPAPGTPFPIGGGVYGTQRCFFLPDLERNTNPNLSTSQ
jgi:hypothetical protein